MHLLLHPYENAKKTKTQKNAKKNENAKKTQKNPENAYFQERRRIF